MKDRQEMAYEDYINGMKYKDIAKKYDTTINTVKSWARRYGWSKKGAHKNKGVHTKMVAKKQAEKIAENMVYENRELDEERQLFCIYYLKYFNQVKALLKIRPDYKYESACVIANRLMKEEAVQKEIRRLKKEMFTEALLDPHDIVQKYIDIAFYDATDYATFDGNKVRLKDSSKVDGTIIQEVKQGRDGISIKFADRMKALDWLTKHLDMANDEQRAKIELIKAQTEKLNRDSSGDDPEDDGVIIINDI